MNLTNHKLCFFSSPFSIIEPSHERNVPKIKIYQTLSNGRFVHFLKLQLIF